LLIQNSLEQLCINLANEALQQHFNFNIFQAEMEFYRSEDIAIPNLDYQDNQDVLDLIVKRTGGIIAMLDEEGVVPNGTVEGFLNKATKAFANHKRFVSKSRTREFAIRHYAGEVIYDPTLFLSKNKDTISQDIIDVMKESNNPFVARLFADSDISSSSSSAAGQTINKALAGKEVKGGSSASSANKQTVGRKFSIQLESLMATLNKTQPHYIRCIKPNQLKRPNIFDSETSNEQLTYSGIFEAVIIMQNGYPFRLPLAEFLKRYHMLVVDETIRRTQIFGSHESVEPVTIAAGGSTGKPNIAGLKDKTGILRQRCDSLVKHAATAHSQEILRQCHVGKTMVLYKSLPHKCLEKLRYSVILKATLAVQRFQRGSIIRAIIRRIKQTVAHCRNAIFAADVPRVKQFCNELECHCDKLVRLSHSQNLRPFPIIEIGQDYAAALIKEKANEDTIHRLLSNSSVPHVVANINELCAVNEQVKSVVFSAKLDNVELRRVWSDNPKLVDADSRIRKFRISVDMRKELKDALQDRDDMKIEDLMMRISKLREQRELVSGYCSDDEKKGIKIVNEAKAAFSELLSRSIVSLTNGELLLKRDPTSNDLICQVSASSITELYNSLSVLPAFNNASSSNTRARLLMALCKYVKDLRTEAENHRWVAVENLLRQYEVCGGCSGLSRSLSTLASNETNCVQILYSPPEIEAPIASEMGKYRVCVVQHLVLPIIKAKLAHSPALQDLPASMEVPSTYLGTLHEAVELLKPYQSILAKDPYLKTIQENVEIRESLWRSLFEGNAEIIRNVLATMKQNSLADDPDFEYAVRQLQMHSLRELIYQLLITTGPVGEPGHMDFNAITTEPLSKALKDASLLVLNDSAWNVMIGLCNKVLQLRGLLVVGDLTGAAGFCQSLDSASLSPYLKEDYLSASQQSLGPQSSGYIVAKMLRFCTEEVFCVQRELMHLNAMEKLVVAIQAGCIAGEVGNILLNRTDPRSMQGVLVSVERDLIRNEMVSQMLSDIEAMSSLRRLALSDNWQEIEGTMNQYLLSYASHDFSSGSFRNCHPSLRSEFLVIYGEVQDRKLRRLLTQCIENCRYSHDVEMVDPPETRESDGGDENIYYDLGLVRQLQECVRQFESPTQQDTEKKGFETDQKLSFETSYLLTTAQILLCLVNAVNATYWEPSALYSSRMSLRQLRTCFTTATENENDKRQQQNLQDYIDSVDENSNFDALENINLSIVPTSQPDLSTLSVAEILVYAAYTGVHTLASGEINRIRMISFDRRCRACILLGVVKGRIGGSIHSGFDTAQTELSSLIRSLKYIKLYQIYWSPVVAHWSHLGSELLNIRLAVLSAEGSKNGTDNGGSGPKGNKLDLSAYLNLEHLSYLIEKSSSSSGFPFQEIKFVVDHVNDSLLIKDIFEALRNGRPQYVMGTFATQYVEYEHLASLLQRSKKLRQRSDKLDRLMFYSDLCVLARKALTRHNWDDTLKILPQTGANNKSTDRNPGVKQCVEEYRLANKFFSMNKMEGIPPKCLIDEFESMEREFDKRNILQDFSAVLQSGAITGAPFALHFREISVSSLEAQVLRVRRWEEGTGIVDIDLETLCKACSEILQIRTQVQQIQASYRRSGKAITLRPSAVTSSQPVTKVHEILASGFLSECIVSALENTASLAKSPCPMIVEWQPVERIVSRVEIAATLRSSKQEIDLVTAESYSRNFIAKVVGIFMGLESFMSIPFSRANQAVIDLTYAYQSYSTRLREMTEYHKTCKKQQHKGYSSPILEMVHDSTILFIHLLRATQLNIYDTPHRNWRQINIESNYCPKIHQLIESLSSINSDVANSAQPFSVQSLIRTCSSLSLHPRLVIYVKELISYVEDKVTEAELLTQLVKKSSGRRRSMVGDMDKTTISTDEFMSSLQRIKEIGIHNSSFLSSLYDSSVLVCNLRIITKKLDYAAGYAVLRDFIDEGRCKTFGDLLEALNQGRFSVHSSARMEFVQLTLELCDGYWRTLAEEALAAGAVVGQRGFLEVQRIGWAAINKVISYSKSHLELSPESFRMLDICFCVRSLRAQVLGVVDSCDNNNRANNVSADDPVIYSQSDSKLRYIVNDVYLEDVVSRALQTIATASQASNIPPTGINFPAMMETVSRLRESVAAATTATGTAMELTFQKQSTKVTLLAELKLVHQHMEFLQARSQLLIATDMQCVWFTEFGLEIRSQFNAVIQSALDLALLQNWDYGVLHERWCRSLLDTMLSVQLLHEQVRFTGMSAIQPCTPEFEMILPFVNGALGQFRALQQLRHGADEICNRQDKCGDSTGLPANLVKLANHLEMTIAESSNIGRLFDILRSDSLVCQVNYAGKFLITVTHNTPVTGLNFYNTEYGPYALKLKLTIDKIKVTTFVGRQIQKLTKMFVTMRMNIKQSLFCEALALSETIGVMQGSNLMNVHDCVEVNRYCKFLTCRRSLEQSLCTCIIPPFAGWSDFGAMPVLGLAINDGALAESIENTLKILPNYAVEYPEILSLMDLGLLFLKLGAAVRTKSWKTLSETARAASTQQDITMPSPTGPAAKVKGRRHSMLTTGLDNLKSTAAVSSAAALSIETNSTIAIIDSLPVQYRPQFAPLKAAILFHCGETVEQIARSLRTYLKQPKVVLDITIRSFVSQIASQVETELKFSELEGLAVSAFKDCKISGSPGKLCVSTTTISSLENVWACLENERLLVRSCYSLKRAMQTATLMTQIHKALNERQQGMEVLGKCLCLLSYMGSRKRLVQEAKCEDLIYRETVPDEILLTVDEFSFKSGIKELVRRLKSASSGHSLDIVIDNDLVDDQSNPATEFLCVLADELLGCPLRDVVRLRDEFFDDLAILEQHFTIECHYADYLVSLASSRAVGEPGDLDTADVEYESLATILHSLKHFGLVTTACPAGSLLYMAVEAIYYVRKGQKLGDFDMLKIAVRKIEDAEAAENEYLASLPAGLSAELGPDARLKNRAFELGLIGDEPELSGSGDITAKAFISAAREEVVAARSDVDQRELIVGLRKGINEAVVTIQILRDIDIFQSKTSVKSNDLPISLLYYAVNTLAKECSPSSRKAVELQRTAETLLEIRQSINARKWIHLRHYIESVDLALIAPSNKEEVNIALRVAVTANVVEKSGRAYKVGSIYGHPGKIEDFANIDCSVVEDALKAFEDISDSWKTGDIVRHYNSCVVLHGVRKYFRQSNWNAVRDMASTALEQPRLSGKPLFVSAEVEIKLAYEHSTYMICYDSLSKACSTGKLKGDAGSIDTSEVSVLVLNKALAISKALNSSMAEIAVLETSAEILRDVRQAELVGHWISSGHTDSMESFSVERAVLATSYSVLPADVFGHSLDGNNPGGHGRYLNMQDIRSSPTDPQNGSSTSLSSAFETVGSCSNTADAETSQSADATAADRSITHKFVAQSTLFDPDLTELYTVSRSRQRSTSFGDAVSATPSESIRSVKEIIHHAREVQSTMDLSTLILDELDLASNEVIYREISFNLLKAIRTSGISGEPGALDLTRVRTHDLVDAVAAAETHSELSRKSSCRWLLRDAKLLLSLRQKTMQHNWKLLSMLFRDVERQNSPDFIDPTDKQPGLPIIMPVWKEVQLVMADVAFQLCLAQFAQEMQNLHEYAVVGTKNAPRVVAMIRVLVTTMRASAMYPCQLFAHLVEAQSVALELRVFHNFEPDKNPVDIIHRVGEAKRRDLSAGKVSYMTLLMSDISNMSNVVDKQLYVDSLQNELINGQLYLMRPLGRIDTSVLDVDRLSKALEVAMPLVSVMGSPSEIRLLRVCEAAVSIRTAVKSNNWISVREVMEAPDFAEVLKSAYIHDEIDRLQCEIENFEACLLLERTMYMGRYMNVVNLARLECKPRGSVVERSMSAGEKRRVSQLPNSFFGGLESLERAMLAGNIVNRRSEILNSYLRAASLIYRIRDKMAHGQWEDLKTLLQDESKYSTLPQFAMEEIRAVKAGMAYRNTMFSVCNALINGCVTGVPGNVIISTVDAYGLQQAMNEAANLDMSDTATRIMFDVGTCVCRLRNAVKEGRWFPEAATSAVPPRTDDDDARRATIVVDDSASTTSLPHGASRTMAAFMFETINTDDSDEEDLRIEQNQSSVNRAHSEVPAMSHKPFASTTSAFGKLYKGPPRYDSEMQNAVKSAHMQTSVQEIVREFLSKKEYNYQTLREALSIDDTEDEMNSDNKADQDWMLQQWEALVQVGKEVDLVSGELKERKVSSSLVFALENIPPVVANFTGMSVPTSLKRSSAPSTSQAQGSGDFVSEPTASLSEDHQSSSEEDVDPLNIRILERALDECSVPSLSKATDEVSRETERLISTAKLILRFRISLQNFELDSFKGLLEEAKSLQNQGVLSSHYGLHELSVYRSSAVAVTIAKSKLLQSMRNGCVSGRLDAVLVEKIDSSVLYYWLNACTALSQSAKGIIGDLDSFIEEATRLTKLRDAVKVGEWTKVQKLLASVPLNGEFQSDGGTNSRISTAEILHIRMICRYRDSSAELSAQLEDEVAVMDSSLVTRIPPLESCLNEVELVLNYQSDLLPPGPGGSLLSDRDLREQFRVGTNVLRLWNAIRNNHWNVDGIASSNLHYISRPKDPLLCRLFDSISQHEVARKLDTIHSQLQSLGFDKTAHFQPHKNIRSSIHLSLVMSGTGLNPAHALENPFASFATTTTAELRPSTTELLIKRNGASGLDSEQIAPSKKPKKIRRISVLTDASMMPAADSSVRSAGQRPVCKPSNRRRSISEVAPQLQNTITVGANAEKKSGESASELLCRENWSMYPTNIRKLFNHARDKMIDLILRTRLMLGCKDGAIQLDALGDIVVPPFCTDLIDIVLTDISRLQSFCIRYGMTLALSEATQSWYSTARTLLKCRRALAYNQIESATAEMISQGYMGRFRKLHGNGFSDGGSVANGGSDAFDGRPCREELDRIERFLFEHVAEKTIRRAIEYLLSIPSTEAAINTTIYHHRHVESLKQISVLPQSMRQPTPFYLDLMSIARELRQAISATIMGDLNRLLCNEYSILALTNRDGFSLSDIHSSVVLLFSLCKTSIVGTKRFHSAAAELKEYKSNKKKTTEANENNLVGNPYASDLRRRLSDASSEGSTDSAKPKRSLASLLFGSTQQGGEVLSGESTGTCAVNNSLSIHQRLNEGIVFENESQQLPQGQYHLDGSFSNDGIIDDLDHLKAVLIKHDPFNSSEDIERDTEDFVSRRVRRSVEFPGIIYIQHCEISNLSYAALDTNFLSRAQWKNRFHDVVILWEKVLHEIVTFRPPNDLQFVHSNKQQQCLQQHMQPSPDDRQDAYTSRSQKVRSLLAQEANETLEELHSLFTFPTVEESILGHLRSCIGQFSVVFRMQEPLLCFTTVLLLQCLTKSREVNRSTAPHAPSSHHRSNGRSAKLLFAVIPIPSCVISFFHRIKTVNNFRDLGYGKIANSPAGDTIAATSHKLKAVDYFAFSIFLQEAIRYCDDMMKHQKKERRSYSPGKLGDGNDDDDDVNGSLSEEGTLQASNTPLGSIRAYIEETELLAKRCLASCSIDNLSCGINEATTAGDAGSESTLGTDVNKPSTNDVMSMTRRAMNLCGQLLPLMTDK
jgi:hypothetical protein